MPTGSGEGPLSADEIRRISQSYGANRQLYDGLATEAKFLLDKVLPATIKIHTIAVRVKDLDKVLEKAERKHYDDAFAEMHDLVGLRIVCLFVNDIAEIAGIIRKEFDVVGEENKIDGAEIDTFGYMALHFDVRLPHTFAGPRYDDLREFTFAIQVRTLLMDAWANVSHHLDYKRESSIPAGLRRDFIALSGLFYVADRHFEMFMRASDDSQRRAESDLSKPTTVSLEEEPLDADTLYAYMARRYPDRETSPRDATSEFAAQLIDIGFKSLGDVDELLNNNETAVLEEEKEVIARQEEVLPFYTGLGVLRTATALGGVLEAKSTRRNRAKPSRP